MIASPGGGSARAFLVALAAAVLIGAAALALAGRDRTSTLPARPAAERPGLLLLTSLPLMFAEDFTLEGGGSPALDALKTRYAVIPIGTTEAKALSQARLLLMAHPLAQPAEALVELDAWVRNGGRVLLLADPMLDWPSKRPLGDNLRPPPAFADTGLLAHWGLRLDSPDEPGRAERELGGRKVVVWSPGSIGGRCAIGGDGFVARCRVGKGLATVVADADFLNVEQLDGARHNLEAVLAELHRLEPPPGGPRG